MERHELNQMFDRLAPTPAQEQAVWDRLLQTERKVTPMKKLKRSIVIGIAAALMIATCAAAVVTGIDQRLIDHFGGGEQAAELLAPGAVPVDVTVEDNGATLHVTQVLMDRYNIMLLADFTAPEGTVLDMDEGQEGIDRGFGGMDCSMPDLLDETQARIDLDQNWAWYTEVLDDGDPLDDHLTLLLHMELSAGIQPDWNISGLSLHNKDLVRYDPEQGRYVTVYPGDWSCQVPITWQDMGRSIQVDQPVGQLDGADITLTKLYLSPMTLQVHLERDAPVKTENMSESDGLVLGRWVSAVNAQRVTLTAKDGRTISLTELGGAASDTDNDTMFQLNEITDLAQLQTLTLRIGDGSVDIPLDGLVPAE